MIPLLLVTMAGLFVEAAPQSMAGPHGPGAAGDVSCEVPCEMPGQLPGDALVERAWPILADASVWEKYSRIRRGEAPAPEADSAASEAAARGKPAEKTNPPANNNQQGVPHDSTLTKAPLKPVQGASSTQATTAKTASAYQLVAPREPDAAGSWWSFFSGSVSASGGDVLSQGDAGFQWSYARRQPLPDQPRVLVSLYDTIAGSPAVSAFAPAVVADIELRIQDSYMHASIKPPGPGVSDGTAVSPTQQRIVAALQLLDRRYEIADSNRGLILQGNGSGSTAALDWAQRLPASWRERVAWVSLRGTGESVSMITITNPDFENGHYRLFFDSDAPGGKTMLQGLNELERRQVGAAAAWQAGGGELYERGVRLPDLSAFEVPGQDISLSRAHPAFTGSTGNYPLTARQRLDLAAFPRGHYNLGIIWDYQGVIDDPSELVFPLRYTAHSNLGPGIENQPARIRVDVTPRRSKGFRPRSGETIKWEWNGGALSGTAIVRDGVVTVKGLPLESGEPYKLLRLFR